MVESLISKFSGNQSTNSKGRRTPVLVTIRRGPLQFSGETTLHCWAQIKHKQKSLGQILILNEAIVRSPWSWGEKVDHSGAPGVTLRSSSTHSLELWIAPRCGATWWQGCIYQRHVKLPIENFLFMSLHSCRVIEEMALRCSVHLSAQGNY